MHLHNAMRWILVYSLICGRPYNMLPDKHFNLELSYKKVHLMWKIHSVVFHDFWNTQLVNRFLSFRCVIIHDKNTISVDCYHTKNIFEYKSNVSVLVIHGNPSFNDNYLPCFILKTLWIFDILFLPYYFSNVFNICMAIRCVILRYIELVDRNTKQVVLKNM